MDNKKQQDFLKKGYKPTPLMMAQQQFLKNSLPKDTLEQKLYDGQQQLQGQQSNYQNDFEFEDQFQQSNLQQRENRSQTFSEEPSTIKPFRSFTEVQTPEQQYAAAYNQWLDQYMAAQNNFNNNNQSKEFQAAQQTLLELQKAYYEQLQKVSNLKQSPVSTQQNSKPLLRKIKLDEETPEERKERELAKEKQQQILNKLEKAKRGRRKIGLSAQIVVVGDERVGKTSLIKQFCLSALLEGLSDADKEQIKIFDEKEQITLGANLIKNFQYLGSKQDYELEVQIWDTAGQERYHSMNKAYYRKAEGALIVYDASEADGNTINRIVAWMSQLRTYLSSDKPIFVVANKFDLQQQTFQDISQHFKISRKCSSKAYLDESLASIGSNLNKSGDQIFNNSQQDINSIKIVKKIEKYVSKFEGECHHIRTSAKTGYQSDICFSQLFNKIWLNKLEVMANAGDKKADYELSLYKEKEAQQGNIKQNRQSLINKKSFGVSLQSDMAFSMLDESQYKLDNIFDDDNSKDVARRSMAYLQASLERNDKDAKDSSFKLTRADIRRLRQSENSGCCFGGSSSSICSSPKF